MISSEHGRHIPSGKALSFGIIQYFLGAAIMPQMGQLLLESPDFLLHLSIGIGRGEPAAKLRIDSDKSLDLVNLFFNFLLLSCHFIRPFPPDGYNDWYWR